MMELRESSAVLQQHEAPPRPAAAAAPRTLWFLCGRVSEGESVRYVPVQTSPFLVGRQASCALSLPCYSVSSAHAEIVDARSHLLLRDLGSTNGTFVNGQRVSQETELVSGDIVQFATLPFRVLQQSASVDNTTSVQDVCDQAMALVLFDRLLSEQAVIPHYQPIVELAGSSVLGFEVLVRSRLAGLEMPASMFSAAAQLNLETRLSQMIRLKAVQETMGLPSPPHLFLNTHPTELREGGLIESVRALRELSPHQPLTLEIHEGAVTDLVDMVELRQRLLEFDVKLAFDDFGAGQARLIELAAVHPEYLKFDISLVRSIHNASRDHQNLVSALVGVVRRMGILSLAEGVERAEDAATCRALGFDLAQGYYFGKPCQLHRFQAGG